MGKQAEPVTVITDIAFSSKKNDELAAQNNINHVPTDLIGKDVNTFLASFHSSQCASCPHKDQCHPKIYKRIAVHMISKGLIICTNKQKMMKTDEYKKYGRIRNGVETVLSMLR